MIIYLLKTIACSGLLLLAYYLLLEKEKMHRFNRLYLLWSIVAAFTIPLITLPIQAEIFHVTETIAPLDMVVFEAPEVIDNSTQPIATPVITETYNWWPVSLIALYFTMSLMLLFRFLLNLLKIITSIRQNEIVNYSGAKLVLTNHQQVPHTFLHYVFLHKNDYENGLIEKEMLCHEMVHVRQKHSLDVLFIEVLLIICWFNPVLYFYRKAIRLDHEFLADDAVVATFQNPVNYQQLLLLSASRPGSLLPASPFNYSITKKRLIMITRNTSAKIAFAKQVAVLPFVAAIVLLFSTKAIAQQNTEKPVVTKDTTVVKGKTQSIKSADSTTSSWNRFTVGSTEEGITTAALAEYESIIKKYETEGKWWHTFSKRVSEQDRNRMEFIFKQMNLEQQGKQFLIFMKPFDALPRAVPTLAQFEAFKNSKVYGVWINGKHVSNTALNNYMNTDFAQFGVSKLYGFAKQGRSYTHQLNMMTKDYYENYYDQTMTNRKSPIGFALNNHPVDSIRQKFHSPTKVQGPKLQIYSRVDNNADLFKPSIYSPGASPKMLNEYDATLRQMTTVKMQKNGKISESLDMSKGNVDRMTYLFRLMTNEQRQARVKRTGVTFSASH